MMIRKLAKMPYANATVYAYDNGDVKLRSYKTDVATICGGWLEIFGLYSMTTRRHISAFVKEYCNMDYATAKMLCLEKLKYNLATGEIEKIG